MNAGQVVKLTPKPTDGVQSITFHMLIPCFGVEGCLRVLDWRSELATDLDLSFEACRTGCFLPEFDLHLPTVAQKTRATMLQTLTRSPWRGWMQSKPGARSRPGVPSCRSFQRARRVASSSFLRNPRSAT
jgi:hypothetical protein